jgi:hypothetical protein
MNIEEVLYRAHYLGIKEEVLGIVQKDYSKTEYHVKVANAYNTIIEQLMKKGAIETKIWESALIKSTVYNSDSESLVVEFNNGAEYSYAGVTKSEYADFVNAESKGKYFLTNIRNKKEYKKSDEN